MTYQSLQEIENKYAESENDSPAKRIENRKNKNQAIKRFNEKKFFQLADASSSTSQNQTCLQIDALCFKTTANSIERKRSLNESLTNEQITNIQNQNKNKRKKRKTNAVLTEQSTNIQEQNTNIQELEFFATKNKCTNF